MPETERIAPSTGGTPTDRRHPARRSSLDRERDLVEAVRAELAAVEVPRDCCRAAERSGLGPQALGRARSPAVARLAVRLEETGTAGRPAAPRRFEWRTARDHCRWAYLRGRFLATGSLSLAPGRMHLEFVVDVEEVEDLVAHLAAVGLPGSPRLRRGRGVVTWKGTETILGFLRAGGASAGVLEIESRLVTRQLHGHLNRVLNAETANLRRSVASAARQAAVIEALDEAGRLARMPEVERRVAEARREAPEATYSELAERLGLSRARLQRAFARLEIEARAVPWADAG